MWATEWLGTELRAKFLPLADLDTMEVEQLRTGHSLTSTTVLHPQTDFVDSPRSYVQQRNQGCDFTIYKRNLNG